MSEIIKSPSPVYDVARKEWNERYGRFRSEARTWRWVAGCAVTGWLMCAGGLVWESVQTHVVPFVVEMNKLGESITVQKLEGSASFDPLRVRPQLARWVYDVRTVYHDLVAQRTLVSEAYAWVDQNSEAVAELNRWYVAHQPTTRGETESVIVTVEDVLPSPGGQVWTVDWHEDVIENGHPPVRTYWRMDVQIQPSPPKGDAELIANPGGFYIKGFHFSQRLGDR